MRACSGVAPTKPVHGRSPPEGHAWQEPCSDLKRTQVQVAPDGSILIKLGLRFKASDLVQAEVMYQQNPVVVGHRLLWRKIETGLVTALSIKRSVLAVEIAEVVQSIRPIRSSSTASRTPLCKVKLIRQLASRHTTHQVEGGIKVELRQNLLIKTSACSGCCSRQWRNEGQSPTRA